MKKHLPINEYSLEIAYAVLENRVTIIEAETGAGKTTQIPQILFNSGLFDGIDITITQPRVMPTISVAHRVAEELGEDVGYSIGYKTQHQKTENYTPITYVTDGYCLSTYGRRTGEKIVIIDEAHEFNLNIETLLGLYKKELDVNPDLKLVVMSATIDSQKVSHFFDGAPIISVPGKTYPVERLWEPSMTVVDCIMKYFSNGTNVLVFLPGKAEIADTYNELNSLFNSTSIQFPAPQVFQLHGEMAYEEQKVVFEHYEEGKIVLATNVAQTSITVPDIDFVIDTGTCKEMISHDGVSILTEVDISQADCSQRAGRAGRCKPGTYVLCSSIPFEHRQYFSKPEIQRISLENLVLKLATMGLDPLDIEFVHNPDRSNLTLAKNLLKKIGALGEDGSITEIGRQMEAMPVSARIARMLIERLFKKAAF
ncbi:MAG: ATP-dependent RNA helicase [Treponema sp.]|nr:ATP-dependent RNA helicase [Treponema sp.]